MPRNGEPHKRRVLVAKLVVMGVLGTLAGAVVGALVWVQVHAPIAVGHDSPLPDVDQLPISTRCTRLR